MNKNGFENLNLGLGNALDGESLSTDTMSNTPTKSEENYNQLTLLEKRYLAIRAIDRVRMYCTSNNPRYFENNLLWVLCKEDSMYDSVRYQIKENPGILSQIIKKNATEMLLEYKSALLNSGEEFLEDFGEYIKHYRILGESFDYNNNTSVNIALELLSQYKGELEGRIFCAIIGLYDREYSIFDENDQIYFHDLSKEANELININLINEDSMSRFIRNSKILKIGTDKLTETIIDSLTFR